MTHKVFFVEQIKRGKRGMRGAFLDVADAFDAIKDWERTDAFALGPYRASKIRHRIVAAVAEVPNEAASLRP